MLALLLLGGCATNPLTGRDQLLALPGVQVAYADLGFAISSGGQHAESLASCAPNHNGEAQAIGPGRACLDAAEVARFGHQVDRLGAELEAAARDLAPNLFERINAFQIGVSKEIGVGTGSSAGGRIVLAPELAGLDPTDDVVAFLIAREMGHVIARHDEEDSGARLVFSVLSAFIPGGSMILKLVASTAGSGVLMNTWAQQQRREADEIALSLLDRTDRSARVVALNLRIGLIRERLPNGKWRDFFDESSERVALAAKVPPMPTEQSLVYARATN